jgi:C1A family cysteine protease
MSDVIDHNGQLYYTGMIPAAAKLSFAPRYSPVASKAEIVDLIQSPTRVKKRDLFGASEIKDQESLGSCNGFAAAGALQRALWLAGRDKENLSGEFLYSQMNGGRDAGSMLDDGMKLIKDVGAPPYKDRHRLKYKSSDFTPEDFRDANERKAFEVLGVDTELELAEGLAKGAVGVVAVHANNSFMKLDKNGIAGGANGPGNHAVLVDDVTIKDGMLCFDHANSWGLNYGDQGRAYLTWDKHLKQPNQYHYFYLITAARTTNTDDIPEPEAN